MTILKTGLSRRGVLKGGLAGILATGVSPLIFSRSAYAYTNEPTGSSVKFGFNVPQTGPYAAEGMDELLAQKLAVEHLNGEGDGGMLTHVQLEGAEGQRRSGQEGRVCDR